MTRWKKHDGSDAIPKDVDPDDVLELDFGWIGCTLPAGAVVGWDELHRYRKTGERSDWRPDRPPPREVVSVDFKAGKVEGRKVTPMFRKDAP